MKFIRKIYSNLNSINYDNDIFYAKERDVFYLTLAKQCSACTVSYSVFKISFYFNLPVLTSYFHQEQKMSNTAFIAAQGGFETLSPFC